MCGIFGIYDPGANIDNVFLRKATFPVSYRGPDAEGIYINEQKTVGLAHKRLSIIDLSEAGKQPMCDSEGKLWITFNGEIYNFHELREMLISYGHRFASLCDTEVLLYAYKQWGTDCLRHLNGMFAFGIYDSTKQKIFLARDRLGKKPIFYSTYPDGIIFSSELKEILVTGKVPTDINNQAVNYYFSLGYIPGDICIVQHVRKLPPGHFLEYDCAKGTAQQQRYWDVPDFIAAKSEEHLLEELETLMSDSISKRLISDVPLGAFLSGGIDSSLVVALMRKVHNGEIKTFSVGFEGSRFSELDQARVVAKHFETSHKEITVTPHFGIELELISELMDEPIYDSSLLPTYLLSKHTRQHVTVALSGDGGDEIFGGYIHYASALTAQKIRGFAIPPLPSVSKLIASYMPDGMFGKNTLYGIYAGSKACFSYPTQIFKEDERALVLNRDFLRRIDLKAPRLYREALMNKNYDFVGQMCYADIKSLLPDDILVKVDRASMFNSLEVRCPFLDYRIAEYAFSHIPGNLRIKNGVKKYLLKRLAQKLLPPALSLERKQGFDIPGDLLFKTHLSERLLSFPNNEFVSRDFLLELVDAQKSKKVYSWHKLFALYFFMRWLEVWRK